MNLKNAFSSALRLLSDPVLMLFPALICIPIFYAAGIEWNFENGGKGVLLATLAVCSFFTIFYLFSTPKPTSSTGPSATNACTDCQQIDQRLKVALDSFEKSVAVWRVTRLADIDAEKSGLAQVLANYREAIEHDYTHHDGELSYELEFDFAGLMNEIINNEELAESSFVKEAELALPTKLMRFIYEQFTPINLQFQLVVAGNPGTPVDIQRELANSDLDWSSGYNDRELGVADLIVVNTSDQTLLSTFAESKNDRTLYLVAENRDTPAGVLDALSTSLERYEYFALNFRESGSVEGVVGSYVVAAVANNPSTSLTTLKSLLARLPKLKPDDLDDDELDAFREAIRRSVQVRFDASDVQNEAASDVSEDATKSHPAYPTKDFESGRHQTDSRNSQDFILAVAKEGVSAMTDTDGVKADDGEQSEPGSPDMRRYFEFVGEDTRRQAESAKFWEITQEGTDLKIRFGKIGANGQTTLKSYPTELEAAKAAEKLIAEKLKKGYEEK